MENPQRKAANKTSPEKHIKIQHMDTQVVGDMKGFCKVCVFVCVVTMTAWYLYQSTANVRLFGEIKVLCVQGFLWIEWISCSIPYRCTPSGTLTLSILAFCLYVLIDWRDTNFLPDRAKPFYFSFLFDISCQFSNVKRTTMQELRLNEVKWKCDFRNYQIHG